jgi:MFS family permease
MHSFLSPLSSLPRRSVSRIARGLRQYAGRLRLFRRNARLYLLNVVIGGVAHGVFYLLFNFYVLSLGYDQALAGRLLTVGSTASLIGALPMGYFSDRAGRKASLLIGNLGLSLSVLGMVVWRTPAALYLLNVLFGLASGLTWVTMGPFVMENSGPQERTYLFSFSAGIQMTSQFLGNWLGGRLPGWLGRLLGFSATSPAAYGNAIASVVLLGLLGLLPLLLLRRQHKSAEAEAKRTSPFDFARRNPVLLAKLIGPGFIISLGAGLVMPFMNLFFRSVHLRSDAAIGTLFAWGSLAMALGLLLAAPLADRWGKIKVVVVSQALSIPFLVMLGFAPWYWVSAGAYLVRLALMNMSWPVYDAFTLEQVEEQSRGIVASLVSMSSSFGWAFSPMISGWMQIRYGFGPIFLTTISTYLLAIFLYWRFFWGHPEKPAAQQMSASKDPLDD